MVTVSAEVDVIIASMDLVMLHGVLISKDLFTKLIATFRACLLAASGHTLALSLRLTNTELLCNEAVFDNLIDILLLGESTLLVQVQIAHLLADVSLVY